MGEVRIVGGLPRAVNIWVDADRLAAYQIPITAVRDALVRQNADLPGGNVTAGLNEAVAAHDGPRRRPQGRSTTWSWPPSTARRCGSSDIGCAEDGTKEQRSAARLNGAPTVILEVRRQSGENTVAVIEGGEEQARRACRQQLPPDVTTGGHPRPVAVHLRGAARDQPAPDPRLHPGLAGRAGLHAVVALDLHRRRGHPGLGRSSAFGVMWALGFTLNSVTMLALVLMVGIVIDDAIVVLENVFRFVEEKKMRPFEAAREATARHRPGRHGHHLLAGRHLRAGVVHVVDLRPVPLPVRHHRGRRRAGLPAGVASR